MIQPYSETETNPLPNAELIKKKPAWPIESGMHIGRTISTLSNSQAA